MDLAGGEVEGNPVVRPHSRKHLGYSVHFQERHGGLSDFPAVKKSGTLSCPAYRHIP
jgi:hypothetical protein